MQQEFSHLERLNLHKQFHFVGEHIKISYLTADGKSKQRKVSKLTVVQSGNMKLSLAVQQLKYNAGEIRLKLSPGYRDAVNRVNFCRTLNPAYR